jgi:hypothetical protein
MMDFFSGINDRLCYMYIIFAFMLQVNTTLLELHMQKYDMRDFGVTRLAETLMHNFTLKYLDLSWYVQTFYSKAWCNSLKSKTKL